MKIAIISVGRIKRGYIKEGVVDYASRIERYLPIEFIETREEAGLLKTPVKDITAREAVKLLSKTDDRDFIVALSDEGKEFDSKAFSTFIEKQLSSGKKRLAFIIGGPFGLDAVVKKKAHLVFSLSRMTLAHETALLLLVEQVYRALADLKGAPYSH